MRKIVYLFCSLFSLSLFAQQFPNANQLSTGQGAIGGNDPIWTVSQWYTNNPGSPNTQTPTFGPAVISNNCAPTAWASPLPGANWITGPGPNCATNSVAGFRYFRLIINLPPDCNGYSVTTPGAYVLNFSGFADNEIVNVYVNGIATGNSGIGFATPGINITLNNFWVVGQNTIDVLVYNHPGSTTNPYGLLLQANPNNPTDTDQDGVPNVSDLCPCDPGFNSDGCPINSMGCDIDAIRTAMAVDGNIELPSCENDCNMYFLNPDILSASAAQIYAQTFGANLISIQSLAESQCIGTAVNNLSLNNVYWIGFSDEVQEGNFVWYDGSPINYTNWAGGEPNNSGGNEDCVQIYANGTWNDLPCASTNAQSIIEFNLCPIPNAGQDLTICLNETIALQSQPALFGSTPYDYSWSNGVNTLANSVSPTVNSQYVLSVTDRYNCTNTDTVNVNVNPLPVVNANSDTTFCIGGSISLVGTGANTYVWDNGVTNGVAFQPTNTLTYTVIGTDLNGCEDTAAVTVNINPLPPVNAGGDFDACFNESITLTGAGAVTYVWDNGVANAVPFYTQNTLTYTLTGTDANGCVNTDQITVTVHPQVIISAGNDAAICINDPVTLSGSGAQSYVWDNGVTDGVPFNPTATQTYTVIGYDAFQCSDTDQVVITVQALPIVSAGNDTTICIGENVTLNGAGANTYLWDNGVTNATPFAPTTTLTYTVTGTNGNGCENTDQVIVTVNPLPLVDAGADFDACYNEQISLSGAGAVTYVWDNGITNTVPFYTQNTLTYTLTGTDANGCVNTDPITVTVHPQVIVSAGNDAAICINDPVTLNGSGAQSYVWDNGVTDGAAFNPTATQTYTVIGYDAFQCSDTDQVVITVHPLPNVNAGNDTAICIGSSITLSGSGAVNYIWDNGVINNQAFAPTTNVTYTVTGTDANGCQNTDQIMVSINQLPIVIASPPQQICIGEGVTLTASGALNYTWTNGVVNGVEFNPTTTQVYNVIGTDANGCSNSSQTTVTVYTYPITGFETNSPAQVYIKPLEIYSTASNYTTLMYYSNGQFIGSSTPTIHNYTESGSYNITQVVSNFICVDSLTMTIVVDPPAAIYVPNSFTPTQKDHINDVWKPIITNLVEYELLIFDRWGGLIYRSYDLYEGWNGGFFNDPSKIVDGGTYVYKINYRFQDGNSQTVQGMVNVIR